MRLDREKKDALQLRLMRNVVVDVESRCWLWQRSTNSCGYPVVQMRLKGYRNPARVLAHRLSYYIFRRRPPKDRQIAHDYRCISRRCVNPAHLGATMQSANERDKRRTTNWHRRQLRELFPPTHFMEAA